MVSRQSNNILTSKDWIPLYKRQSDFIYVHTLTNQFYSVTENKMRNNVDTIIYLTSLFGATVFRHVASFIIVDLPIVYPIGLYVLLLAALWFVAKKQLKKWGNFVNYSPVVLTQQMKEEIISESLKTQRRNAVLLGFVSVAFLVSSITFILTFGLISMVLSMTLGYVLFLLVPTLKLRARKEHISQLKDMQEKEE